MVPKGTINHIKDPSTSSTADSCSRPEDPYASPVAGRGTSLHTATPAPDKEPLPSPEGSSNWASSSRADVPPVSAVGKLRDNIKFWKDVLRPGDFILDTIERGYQIPFVSEPTPCFLRNNASSRAQGDFVRSEIEDLLAKGYVQETSSPAYCCNPLTVAKGKKLRLVLDLRHVNAFVKYQPVKYDSWELLEQVLEEGDYFVSFDLTAAYNHVGIFPEHRKYLGFSYQFSGVTRYFYYVQLPFGLSSACHVFTKLNRPLVKLWRGMGIRAFMYIDDGIGVFRSAENATKSGPIMKAHLQSAGFLVNDKKSNWDPSPSLTWLGFSYDAVSRVISVPEGKLDKFVKECNCTLGQKAVSPRQIAAIAGQLLAMQKALGPETRLKSRYLSFWVNDCLLTRARTFEVDFDPHEPLSGHARTFGVSDCSHDGPRAAHARTFGVEFDPHEPMSGHARTLGVSVFPHDSPMAAHARSFAVDFEPHEPMSGHARTFGIGLDTHKQPTSGHARAFKIGASVSPQEFSLQPAWHLDCWDHKYILSSNAKEELRFWMANIRAKNGRGLLGVRSFDAVCFLDASAEGYGGYEASRPDYPVRGAWQQQEQKMSSAWRELVALLRTMQGLRDQLRNRKMKWFVDNKAVVSILRVGSRKPALHILALEVARLGEELNLVLETQWISREFNQLADEYSRCSDRDDWGLQDAHFIAIDSCWGPHTVDRFPAFHNRKCNRFNSKSPTAETEGVDAFAQDWSKDNNWLCPPVGLIAKVLAHCRMQQAFGTLIVPFWPSAYFWPLLKPDGERFADFVIAHERFYGHYKNWNQLDTCSFDGAPNFDTLALRIRFWTG